MIANYMPLRFWLRVKSALALHPLMVSSRLSAPKSKTVKRRSGKRAAFFEMP